MTYTSDSRFDFVIIGAGIIGLSTALNLMCKRPQPRLVVLEKENDVAQHQSGHNSGLIHSGVYYKPGTLKAKLCVVGATAMAEFCKENGLPLQICGKIIVATKEAEIPRLKALFERGNANGVPGLKLLNCEQIRDIEPHKCRNGGTSRPRVQLSGISRQCAENMPKSSAPEEVRLLRMPRW